MRKLNLIALVLLASPLLASVRAQGYGCEANRNDSLRRDCYPEPDSNEQGCRERNCVWCPANNDGSKDSGILGIPHCYYHENEDPPQRAGYRMEGEPIQLTNGLRVMLTRVNSGRRMDGEFETLTLDAEFQSNYRLRVKVYPGVRRYEVPLSINIASGGNQDPLYEIKFSNSPMFAFQVVRKSTGTVLFDLDPEHLIYADQYLSMSWAVPSENVYGLGENEQTSFKHDFSRNLTWPLFALGHNPEFTRNLYGVQPYYTVLEEDGNAHSVVILNSNAQQFKMVAGPRIEYITIGGVLDLYFFLGPKPENTVQQFTEAIGRPEMPPYWALGFHLCRYGYDSIENMQGAVNRTLQWGIPYDVQWGDIDIMERRLDFTYSKQNFGGLPEYVRELKRKGIRFVPILDPGISMGEPPKTYRPYELGNEMDVWIKRPDGSYAVGRVWPEDPLHFPDYSKNATKQWWRILLKEFHDVIEYDGIWIDMNEPSNFLNGDHELNGCEYNKLNNPRFIPPVGGNYLPQSTICMDTVQEAGIHYDVHSLYGFHQSEPTLLGARDGTGKRSFVLTRSNFIGNGKWAAHWLGDNYALWSNLHYSIIGMLQYNHFGIPFVGADICGHNFDAPAELCLRWMQLGAFYPFSRNHNGYGHKDQDPGAYGAEVAVPSREVLKIRYTLLPYLYTLLHNAYTEGSTVARPLWHEFPTDKNTISVDKQFMWGSGLMISPVLEEGARHVNAYFPNARFYDYYNGSEVTTRGGVVRLDAPLSIIPLHLRGGNVIPTQSPAVNTDLARQLTMGLIVALDENEEAQGSLFYDDGDSIGTVESGKYYKAVYQVENGTLTSRVVTNGYEEMNGKRIEAIRLLGAGKVNSVRVNGNNHADFIQYSNGEVEIYQLFLNPTQAFQIEWN